MATMDAALTKQDSESPEDAIRTAVRAAAGLGVPGLFQPGLDEAGMMTIWTAMVITIAKRQGAELSPATATKLVASAVAGISAYKLGSKILTWTIMLIGSAVPFVTVPAGMAFNVALNALFTYKLGRECTQRFADPTFTKADVLSIGRQLVLMPTLSEIGEIRRLLAGD
jgi:uncharacterized protein (DUF697 family)